MVAKLIVLLSAALLGVSCAGEKEAIKGTVKGTIYVIGNEPFTSLAVESEGKMYRISASKEIQSTLLKLQGKVIEVGYTRIDSVLGGITLTVTSFRQISP